MGLPVTNGVCLHSWYSGKKNNSFFQVSPVMMGAAITSGLLFTGWTTPTRNVLLTRIDFCKGFLDFKFHFLGLPQPLRAGYSASSSGARRWSRRRFFFFFCLHHILRKRGVLHWERRPAQPPAAGDAALQQQGVGQGREGDGHRLQLYLQLCRLVGRAYTEIHRLYFQSKIRIIRKLRAPGTFSWFRPWR